MRLEYQTLRPGVRQIIVQNQRAESQPTMVRDPIQSRTLQPRGKGQKKHEVASQDIRQAVSPVFPRLVLRNDKQSLTKTEGLEMEVKSLRPKSL